MKRIQFDGQTHEFPDDFTDAEIASALQASPLKPATPQPAPGIVGSPFRQDVPSNQPRGDVPADGGVPWEQNPLAVPPAVAKTIMAATMLGVPLAPLAPVVGPLALRAAKATPRAAMDAAPGVALDAVESVVRGKPLSFEDALRGGALGLLGMEGLRRAGRAFRGDGAKQAAKGVADVVKRPALWGAAAAGPLAGTMMGTQPAQAAPAEQQGPLTQRPSDQLTGAAAMQALSDALGMGTGRQPWE
jgi:hypothetical protein